MDDKKTKIYIIKKTLINLAIGIGLSVVTAFFLTADDGRPYGGYLAAFLGAIYLLMAWISYSRQKGGLFANFKLTRKREPPYFLRQDKQQHRKAFPLVTYRHDDDGLEEENQDRLDELLPKPARFRADAISYLICGISLLCLSLFI